MSKDTIDIIGLIVSIVFPTISAAYTFLTNRASKQEQRNLREEQERLRKSQSDIEAIGQYRHIKQMERYFKKDLTELILLSVTDDKDKIHTAFLSCYSSFTDLFNEVNVFCALMNNDALSSEKVLQNTGINLVIKLADDQCDVYERLKRVAETYGHKNEMKRPDRDAFREYDKFLQNRMSEGQWKKLVEKRRNVGLY